MMDTTSHSNLRDAYLLLQQHLLSQQLLLRESLDQDTPLDLSVPSSSKKQNKSNNSSSLESPLSLDLSSSKSISLRSPSESLSRVNGSVRSISPSALSTHVPHLRHHQHLESSSHSSPTGSSSPSPENEASATAAAASILSLSMMGNMGRSIIHHDNSINSTNNKNKSLLHPSLHGMQHPFNHSFAGSLTPLQQMHLHHLTSSLHLPSHISLSSPHSTSQSSFLQPPHKRLLNFFNHSLSSPGSDLSSSFNSPRTSGGSFGGQNAIDSPKSLTNDSSVFLNANLESIVEKQLSEKTASRMDVMNHFSRYLPFPPGIMMMDRGQENNSFMNEYPASPSSPESNSAPTRVKTVLKDKDTPATGSSSPSSVPVVKRRERTMLPCSYCGKSFDRPSLLKRHLRTHTGEKPHVCDVCGKGFSTSSSLNTHRRIHSGEKPHQCGVCGKRFTASSNLYYHRMTHNKEKPHKCSLCSKSFPTPGDLKSHMYVHNGSWPFKCSICNRGFSKQTNLRNHMFHHLKKNSAQISSSTA